MASKCSSSSLKKIRRQDMCKQTNGKENTNDTDGETKFQPTIIVIDNSKPRSKILTDAESETFWLNKRTCVVNSYSTRIPTTSSEAQKASLSGSWKQKTENQRPGIPSRKFCVEDLPKYGTGNAGWPVQTVFKNKSDPTKYHVYYEGWTCLTSDLQDSKVLIDTIPSIMKEAKVRDDFIEAVQLSSARRHQEAMGEGTSSDDFTDLVPIKSRENLFWLYQDMSFFHSLLQKNRNLAAVYYISCSKSSRIAPPNYAYTAINIVSKAAYNVCLESRHSETFLKLNQLRRWTPQKTGCENERNCVCYEKHSILYGGPDVSQNVKSFPNGRINFNGFDQEVLSVKIECSDACECSERCPRRVVQRGQQHPLVVFYEKRFKGFGLRAASIIKKGDFICEYTGVMNVLSLPSTDGNKKASYDFVFQLINKDIVIGSKECGNISRFINHSCDPNTVFLEVHSRQFERDVLIPRVGVFALKDIAIGEAITLRYYQNTTHVKKTSIECKCQSINCMKYLPEHDGF